MVGYIGQQRELAMTTCMSALAYARSAWRRRGMSRDPSHEQGIAGAVDVKAGVKDELPNHYKGFLDRYVKYADELPPCSGPESERDDSPAAMFRRMDGAAVGSGAAAGAAAPVSDKVEHLNKLLAEQKSAPAPQTKEKTGVITDEELTSQHAIDESQISDRLSKPLLARKTARLNAAPALAPVPTPEELALKAARLNVQLERRKNAAPAPAPVPTPAEDAPSAGELEADVYVLLTAIRWATLNGHIERCLETLKVLEAWDPPAGEGPFPAEVRASLQKEWVRMFGEYGAIPPSMLVNERRFLERNYDNRSLELRLRHRL